MLKWIVRTVLALLLSRICVAVGLICWVNATLLLAHLAQLPRLSPVMFDTVLLSLPLAVYPVDAGIGLLSLPPLLLACWARHQTVGRRFVAAVFGLTIGLGLVLLWQNALTWWTGYAFVQRYALPDPVTRIDYLFLAGIAGVEAWFTIHIAPWAAKTAEAS